MRKAFRGDQMDLARELNIAILGDGRFVGRRVGLNRVGLRCVSLIERIVVVSVVGTGGWEVDVGRLDCRRDHGPQTGRQREFRARQPTAVTASDQHGTDLQTHEKSNGRSLFSACRRAESLAQSS